MGNQSFTTLPKDSFPKLLKELMHTLNLEKLKSGFKACGIYPMDPNEVLKKIPGESAKEIAAKCFSSGVAAATEHEKSRGATKNKKKESTSGSWEKYHIC